MSDDTKKPAVDQTAGAKPEVAEAIRIANEIERQRKSVPVVMGSARVTIPAKEKIARYAKPHGGQDAKGGRHFLFVPEKEIKDYAYRGMRPELDAGNLVHNETDVLVSTSTEAYRETLAQNQALDVKTREDMKMAEEEATKKLTKGKG